MKIARPKVSQPIFRLKIIYNLLLEASEQNELSVSKVGHRNVKVRGCCVIERNKIVK